MAHRLKSFIVQQITNASEELSKLPFDKVSSSVQYLKVLKSTSPEAPHAKISFSNLRLLCSLNTEESNALKKSLCNLTSKDVKLDSSGGIIINQKRLVQDVLTEINRKEDSIQCPCPKYFVKGGSPYEFRPGQNVIVEFSSPNIAKPFHVGHLRSTIIGNFISNINDAVGNNVTRLNYLGDWGTQFGILGVGFKKYGSKENLENDAMRHLFQVYVQTNIDIVEEKDIGSSKLYDASQDWQRKMEEGDKEVLQLWKDFRERSVISYDKLYQRIGIKFDSYEGESMFCDAAKKLTEKLMLDGIAHKDSDGFIYANVSDVDSTLKHPKLLKSDGTSLYLSRDLAAISQRHEKRKFDQIHYVVENGQNMHFKYISSILQRMNVPWIKNQRDLHVKFGRVLGMSSRKGTVVFLEDVLNEAKSRMIEKMKNKQTTKASNIPEIADVLGISGIIVQDLKERRRRDYEFNWDRTLSTKGDSGVFMQYGYSRLCSLEENVPFNVTDDVDYSLLTDSAAVKIAQHLANFDDTVFESYLELEPCILVQYLLRLVHLSNAGLASLRVKDAADDIAQARLLLFTCSKHILGRGMRLLGLKPLNRM